MNKLINKNREPSIKSNSNNLKENSKFRDSQKNLNHNNNSKKTENKPYRRNSLNLSKNVSMLLSEKIKNNLKINNH
jgi:hypothetical protein